MSNSGYLRPAVERVFGDRTIWWRTPVLAALSVVPILGTLVESGYSMILMRDVAWGQDRGLPRFTERSQIAKRGISALLIGFVWSLGLFFSVLLIAMLATAIGRPLGVFAPRPFPWWGFSVLFSIPAAVLQVFLQVALLRSAIYMTTSAGLSISGVRNLIYLNSERFRRVAAGAFAVTFVTILLSLPSTYLVSAMPQESVTRALLPYLWSAVIGLVTIPLRLVLSAAYGLWGSETDPSSWPSETIQSSMHSPAMEAGAESQSR